MEKLNLVRDEKTKLPPGFRFEPTDEEIVFQYLSRKIFSHPLPAQIIPEIDVFAFDFDPSELPGDLDQDKYFFRKKGGNNGGGNSCGFWRAAAGSVKRIICSKRLMPIVGIRKSFQFYKGGKQSDWLMHEYCIAFSGNSDLCNNIQHTKTSQDSLIRIGDWTLCHIYKKKRSAKRQVDDDEDDDDVEDMYSTYDVSSDTDSSSASSSSPRSDSSIFSDVSSN